MFTCTNNYNINKINKICAKEHPKQFISMQKTPDPNDSPLISEQQLMRSELHSCSPTQVTHRHRFSGLISWTSKLARNDAAQSWPPPMHDWKTCVPLSECHSQSWRKKKEKKWRESSKVCSTGCIFCCLLIIKKSVSAWVNTKMWWHQIIWAFLNSICMIPWQEVLADFYTLKTKQKSDFRLSAEESHGSSSNGVKKKRVRDVSRASLHLSMKWWMVLKLKHRFNAWVMVSRGMLK